MKRSKFIIRFLEKHDAESVRKVLDELYSEWREATNPPVKVDKYVREQLFEISDFVTELEEYVRQENFSEVGFYVLAKSFFDNGCVEVREQFIREIFVEMKRNSSVKMKKKLFRKINKLLAFIKAIDICK